MLLKAAEGGASEGDAALLAQRVLQMHKGVVVQLGVAPRLYQSLLELYGRLYAPKRQHLLQQQVFLKVGCQ